MLKVYFKGVVLQYMFGIQIRHQKSSADLNSARTVFRTVEVYRGDDYIAVADKAVDVFWHTVISNDCTFHQQLSMK